MNEKSLFKTASVFFAYIHTSKEAARLNVLTGVICFQTLMSGLLESFVGGITTAYLSHALARLTGKASQDNLGGSV